MQEKTEFCVYAQTPSAHCTGFEDSVKICLIRSHSVVSVAVGTLNAFLFIVLQKYISKAFFSGILDTLHPITTMC